MAKEMPVIYIISDALGETAEYVSRAAAAQFSGIRTKIRKVPYVQDEVHVDEILEEAMKEQAIIAYTLVVKNFGII